MSFRLAVMILALSGLGHGICWGVPRAHIPFEDQGDLLLFNELDSAASEIIAGGATGSSGLGFASSKNANGLSYEERSYRYGNAGDFIVLSTMFKFAQIEIHPPAGHTYSPIALKLSADPLPQLLGVSTIHVDLDVASQGPDLPLVFKLSAGYWSGYNGSGRSLTIDPLSDQHWYQYKARFTRARFRDYIDVRLIDYGMGGNAPTSVAVSHRFELFGGEDRFTDASAWAGFSMRQINGGGTLAVDDFQILPEPNSWALSVFLFGGVVVLRRRQCL